MSSSLSNLNNAIAEPIEVASQRVQLQRRQVLKGALINANWNNKKSSAVGYLSGLPVL